MEKPEGVAQDQMRANLESLRENGVDPYPRRFERSHHSREVVNDFDRLEGSEVTVAGRLMAVRGHGKAGFADLVDVKGKMQLYVRRDEVGDEQFAVWELLNVGDIVGARGEVFRTRSDEVSLKVKKLVLLAKALLPLPEKWHGLKDKELRYRRRYLDLISNEETRAVFRTRSRIVRIMREFLTERDFLEAETPILQPIYGGAFARAFETHHRSLDLTLYLRIADELYLKRLIVGGFERVFEIGKDFRNEGMDRTHSPEFTQLELYQAYADYNVMMETTESLFERLACELHGGTRFTWQGQEIDVKAPWKRVKVMDAVAEVVGEDALRSREALVVAARAAGLDPDDLQGDELPSFGKLVEKILDELVEPKLTEPTFLIDYPLEISPLAKQTPDDPDIVERFEIFIAGIELGNSFTELNDPDEQVRRLSAQVEKRAGGDEEAHGMDEDFIMALRHGMPPTGGLGIGVDRVVMLMTDSPGIRDVILFPTMRPEQSE